MERMIGLDEFRAALRMMDTQRRLLHDARADEGLLRAYDAILRHLYRLPDHQRDRLLGRHTERTKSQLKKEKDERLAEKMSIAEVERLLADEDASRASLEAVAVGRFQVPRGSMRSMGNIDQLRETLRTLVQNELAHRSISEVAQEHRG